MENINFAKRTSIEFVEEGQTLAPKFNEEGILPVVVTESESGAVLMIGFMNKNALEKTIQTKEETNHNQRHESQNYQTKKQ